MSNNSPALLSKDIVDLQDIEKIQFLQSLQADPARYSEYIQNRTQEILGEVTDAKRSAFQKISSDMARMMDMDHNSLAALVRSEDVASMQEHILQEQEKLYGSAKYNQDLTRRQVEINNWYYENKRETLFVLQLTLLLVLVAVILLIAQTYGFLNEAAVNWSLSGLFMIGIVVWLYRWYYTAYMRDPRFWSRRSFNGDNSVPKRTSEGELCLNY